MQGTGVREDYFCKNINSAKPNALLVQNRNACFNAWGDTSLRFSLSLVDLQQKKINIFYVLCMYICPNIQVSKAIIERKVCVWRRGHIHQDAGKWWEMVHSQAEHKKWSRWEDIKKESDGTQSKQLQQLEGMPRTNQIWSKMMFGWEPFNETQRVWFSLTFCLHLLTRQIFKIWGKSFHFPKMLKNNPNVNWHLSFQSSVLFPTNFSIPQIISDMEDGSLAFR